MRRTVVLIGAILILAMANVTIFQKEQVLNFGQPVLLELAPVDPRSLMQGDYMALRFKVANDAFSGVSRDNLADGRLVLALNERNIGSFVRFDTGAALGPQEVVMQYRIRDNTPKFGTNAFFFQEGTADVYQNARYGEFRVSDSGEAILTTLRGENLEVLGQ